MTPAEDFFKVNPPSRLDFRSLRPPLPREFPESHPSGGCGFFLEQPIAWIFFRCATVFSCITSLLKLSWHVYFLALHFTREPHLICTAGTSTYPGQSDWTLFNPWLSRGKKGFKFVKLIYTVKKGFKFVKLIYTVNTIIQLYLTCLNVCLRK